MTMIEGNHQALDAGSCSKYLMIYDGDVADSLTLLGRTQNGCNQ